MRADRASLKKGVSVQVAPLSKGSKDRDILARSVSKRGEILQSVISEDTLIPVPAGRGKLSSTFKLYNSKS